MDHFKTQVHTDTAILSEFLGPVVQSIFSLTSSLGVKMLTAQVSTGTVSNSQLFLLKKCE